MPYETSHHFDSVCIIESLALPDDLTGTSLYNDVLKPLADREGFMVRHYAADTRNLFFDAFQHIRHDFVQQGHGPINHIEAHGDEDHTGIVLASGEMITWEELRVILTEINIAVQFNLLLVMALCSGWWLSSILLPSQPWPVWGIVGPTETVGDRDLKQAMAAFYREMFHSYDARKAMDQANDQRPYEDWTYRLETADLLFCRAFRHHMEIMTDAELQERLNWIVAENFRVYPDRKRSAAVREWARGQLLQHEKHYNQVKRQFLMLDRFPGNEKRFPLRYEDCKGHGAQPSDTTSPQ